MLGIERQVLAVIGEEREVSREDIARRIGVSADYVDKILNDLIEARYISKTRKNYYKLRRKAKKALSPWRGALIASSGP